MAPTPGVLYVTMQPKPSLPIAQFHDWYNNEHGPGRLRLSFCQNGFRYRASDLSSQGGTQEKPEYMAIYDIEDMDYLTKDVYTTLRMAPKQSQRERDTMKQIFVDRRFYDLVGEERSEQFKVLEDVANEGEKNVVVAEYTSSEPSIQELEKIKNIPGWRRTRQFTTSYLDIKDGRTKEYLSLHEYAATHPLHDTQHTAEKKRTYDLYYTFGPAPRDLSALTSPDTFPVEFAQGLTKTTPQAHSKTKHPVIESFITTPDGVDLPYQLTGSSDPNAPLLICINAILTTRAIWSDFISAFLAISPDYRVLSYNSRGRSTLPPTSTTPITIETLSTDIITILDALRIKQASLIGVSLGGATALNTALTHPTRIAAFVACDTNSVAPAGNPKAWGERIQLCEKEGATSSSSSNEAIVGQNLADVTTRRWFVPASYDDAALAGKAEEVKQMVAGNSLDGFRKSVTALYEYDFRPQMREFAGEGAFLVGAGDGVLPETMRVMAEGLGAGVELRVVEGAGHLPMVERPGEVAEFVARFLG
jgi:pimeloyl-ACP methyl ester carboxylesterase